MSSTGLSLLTIARRNWADQREVRCANISASWRVSQIGRLSATIASRDAWLLGIDDYLGMWVYWAHPTLGAWGGTVEDVTVSFQRGTLELSCASFANAMKHRRTAKRYGQASGPPGSLVLRAITDLSVRDLPFTSVGVDTSGNPVSMSWRGDDLYSVVSRLASQGGKQFDVTVDVDSLAIAFEFRTQTGRDRTGYVSLCEGYHIADGTVASTIANLINDRLAVSAEQSWDTAVSAVALNGPSIRLYGHKQDTQSYYGFATPTALANRARSELAVLASPQIPVSFRLSDRELQLVDFIQGDTIRVVSSSANAEYLVTVMGRAVDADTGVVTIVGNAQVAA